MCTIFLHGKINYNINLFLCFLNAQYVISGTNKIHNVVMHGIMGVEDENLYDVTQKSCSRTIFIFILFLFVIIFLPDVFLEVTASRGESRQISGITVKHDTPLK